MSAPVDFFSGALAAQNGCATGEFALKGKPSGANARHCALPVARRSKLGLPFGRANTARRVGPCR